MASGSVAPRPLAAIVLFFLLFSACAAPSGSSPAPVESRGAPARDGATAPKTITIAVSREIEFLVHGFGGGEGADATAVRSISNDLLVEQNETGNWVPSVAAEMISLENGTWQLNPDGS